MIEEGAEGRCRLRSIATWTRNAPGGVLRRLVKFGAAHPQRDRDHILNGRFRGSVAT
jgi:hypothetical protein